MTRMPAARVSGLARSSAVVMQLANPFGIFFFGSRKKCVRLEFALRHWTVAASPMTVVVHVISAAAIAGNVTAASATPNAAPSPTPSVNTPRMRYGVRVRKSFTQTC